MTGSIEQGTGFMLKGCGLITCSHVVLTFPPETTPLAK